MVWMKPIWIRRTTMDIEWLSITYRHMLHLVSTNSTLTILRGLKGQSGSKALLTMSNSAWIALKLTIIYATLDVHKQKHRLTETSKLSLLYTELQSIYICCVHRQWSGLGHRRTSFGLNLWVSPFGLYGLYNPNGENCSKSLFQIQIHLKQCSVQWVRKRN